jgi:hypothetical protein
MKSWMLGMVTLLTLTTAVLAVGPGTAQAGGHSNGVNSIGLAGGGRPPQESDWMAPAAAAPAKSASSAPVEFDWPDLFNPDGSLRDDFDDRGSSGGNGIPDAFDVYGGIDAIFLEDNISAGLATDMSALRGAARLSDSVVYNGTVPSQADLGNAYFFVQRNAQDELLMHAAVERLGVVGDSFVEFEFNRDRVHVASGRPFAFQGGRVSGDVLVHVSLLDGVPTGIEFASWNGADFQLLETVRLTGGQACETAGESLRFCYGPVPEDLPPTNMEVWNGQGVPVEVPSADMLLEVHVNLTRVTGTGHEFSSIQVRSPEDIILGSFLNMGYWGERRRERESSYRPAAAGKTQREVSR